MGIGAGTDFLQWVRSGAKAYGIDITQEAIAHAENRLEQYGFGMIHHSPDTIKALEEIIRCTRPDGLIKIMVYNRRSLNALYLYLKHGLFAGKPFRSFADVIYHHMESLGTKAFTISEVKAILARYPVKINQLRATATNYDLLWNKSWLQRFLAYVLACLIGYHQCGWFLTFEIRKI